MLFISMLANLLQPRLPTEYHWEAKEAEKDCADCRGTGEIEVVSAGSGKFIKCPCTETLQPN